MDVVSIFGVIMGKLKVALLVDEYFGGTGTVYGGYGFLARHLIAKHLPNENIEVEVFGNNSKTIQFTGGIFANNKNKQETQETLSEMLNLLRFKKVNYKWYKYDDEYTYYELDSKNDNEITYQIY